MDVVDDIESLSAGGGGDDRHAEAEGFQDFDARTAASTERHDKHGGAGIFVGDVFNGADNSYTGGAVPLLDGNRYLCSDDAERNRIACALQERQDRVAEMQDGVFIGQIAQGA